MENYEMRSVILRATVGEDINKRSKITGSCECLKPDCVHCRAVSWNTQIHNPENYCAMHDIQHQLKELGSNNLSDIFLNACIGLQKEEILAIGNILLEGVKSEIRKMRL